MLKKMTFAAMLAAAICVYAQTGTSNAANQNNGSMSPSNSTTANSNNFPTSSRDIEDQPIDVDANSASALHEMKGRIMHQARDLSGGDRFALGIMLDRLPGNYEAALIRALYNSRQQALFVRNEMQPMTMVTTTMTAPINWSNTSTSSTTNTANSTTSSTSSTPATTGAPATGDQSTNTTTSNSTTSTGTTAQSTTPAQSTTTTTSTTTVAANTGQGNWSDSDTRPLRMVMQAPKPHSIHYERALEILDSGVGPTDRVLLNQWWTGMATEQDRDVIVRLLHDNASIADEIRYPSTLIRRDWGVGTAQ